MKTEEPIEYVRGFTEFLGCKIDLSKRPLIPRVETEFWVEKVIKEILKEASSNLQRFQNHTIKVLDIFSGSGCIGLAVLKNIKNAEVVFADKEKKAISQIKINLKINKVKSLSSYKVIKSDIFKNINKKNKFDFIFANPPYVAEKYINKVQKSVLDYEPRSALFGGEDGMFFIEKFLKQAKKYLNKTGRIFMEFSPEQKNKIEKLLKKFGYKKWKFKKDQYGKWRWIMIK